MSSGKVQFVPLIGVLAMPKAKAPTLEDILRFDICECATVKDVIDDAVQMSMDWYEKHECKTRQTASLFLAVGMLQQLLIQMADTTGDAEDAMRFLKETMSLVSDIKDDCQPYIRQAFAVAAEGKLSVPQSATLQ